jgi:hypothetical protein
MHADYREKGKGDGGIFQICRLRKMANSPLAASSRGRGTSRDKSKQCSRCKSTTRFDANRAVAAVLSPVGGCSSRDSLLVLFPGAVGTQRPEGGIWNWHDDGGFGGECTTQASWEASWLAVEANWPGWDDRGA